MKNLNHRKNHRHDESPYKISTKLHQPGILKNMVETLANSQPGFSYRYQKVQPGWQAVDTSSVEVFVSGDLNISSEIEHIYASFLTNFLFTCKKDNGEAFKLLWISSLS